MFFVIIHMSSDTQYATMSPPTRKGRISTTTVSRLAPTMAWSVVTAASRELASRRPW